MPPPMLVCAGDAGAGARRNWRNCSALGCTLITGNVTTVGMCAEFAAALATAAELHAWNQASTAQLMAMAAAIAMSLRIMVAVLEVRWSPSPSKVSCVDVCPGAIARVEARFLGDVHGLAIDHVHAALRARGEFRV